jgi:hypothetical protein
VQQFFCKNSNNYKNQSEKKNLLQEICIKKKMNKQTKQLLQEISIEKMMKK